MVDFLSEFTPEELEILKAQNGKFTLKGNELHFDDDLPYEILDKLTTASIIFHQEAWAEGNAEDHREIVFSPEKNNRKFLELFGLTIEREDDNTAPDAKPIVNYDENTALSIITDKSYRKVIRDLAIPGQLSFEIKPDGTAEIVSPKKSLVEEALKQKQKAKGFNVSLLQVIGAGIEQTYLEGANGTISIPREGLQKCLQTTIRKPPKNVIDYILSHKEPKTKEEKEHHSELLKHYAFWFDLLNLSKAGTFKTKDGDFVMFVYEGYNETEDTIECSSPYLRHAYEDLYNNPILGERKNNEPSYKIIQTAHPVLKGNIYNIKNDVTREIVDEIIYRMELRGTVSDAKFEPHYNHPNKKKVHIIIKYSDLIKSCPTLNRRLTESIKKDGTISEPTPQQKRVVLNRAIFGDTRRNAGSKKTTTSKKRDEYPSLIEAILHESTVYYEMYAEFNIKVDPISLKALNRTGIHITHCGINGEYQKEPQLHAPEVIK